MTANWLWAIALPSLLPLWVTAFNVVAWPRGRARRPSVVPRVSVCVPARNEERDIEACVRAAASSRVELHEIVVVDDNSEDRTPEILARLAGEIPSLRVVSHRETLPEGWVGKVHACSILAQAATGDLLLFVDADTRLSADGVARLLDLRERLGVHVVSAVPRQRMDSFFERLMMPLLHLTYTSWLPMPLVWWSSDPRFLAANGQVVLLDGDALSQIGGFASIRDEIVDDMALLRRFKTRGFRVAFADGFHIATTRMYQSAAALWAGFTKNAYEGIGGSTAALAGVLALYLACFVAPYVALAAAPWVPALLAPALVGVAANVGVRTILALRWRHEPLSVLLHPVAVVAFAALFVDSRRLYLADRISWRGRTYARRSSVPRRAT